MLLEQLRAIRTWHQRQADGDFQFVTSCLNGTRGETAKTAAENAILTAVERGSINDDSRIAQCIVELVESYETELVD